MIKMFFTLRINWFFSELITEMFFEEPKMFFFLWHCCDKHPFGSFIFKSVLTIDLRSGFGLI